MFAFLASLAFGGCGDGSSSDVAGGDSGTTDADGGYCPAIALQCTIDTLNQLRSGCIVPPSDTCTFQSFSDAPNNFCFATGVSVCTVKQGATSVTTYRRGEVTCFSLETTGTTAGFSMTYKDAASVVKMSLTTSVMAAGRSRTTVVCGGQTYEVDLDACPREDGGQITQRPDCKEGVCTSCQ